MGKHTKLVVEPPITANESSAFSDFGVDETLRETLELLRGLQRTLMAQSELTPQLVRESHGLARAVVSLAREQMRRRQVFALDAKKLSLPLVMEFLRGLGEVERHNVIRELAEMDEAGSVLA